jgi:hypothetical protein
MFGVAILRFQKWFDVDVLDFQIELCCRYFGLVLTWQLFGLFFQKFGNFFLIVWSSWSLVIYVRAKSCLLERQKIIDLKRQKDRKSLE